MTFLRFLMLLSLTVWIGGILFLSFVEAPTVFSVVPTRHMAGTVVGHSLSIMHWMGLFSGVVFLGSSMLLSSLTTGSAQPLAARHILILVMLLLTAISQFGVSPKMASLRAQFGDIDTVPATDPGRLQFDSLHVWSVRLEVAVLALGFIVIYLTARPIP
jgi:putative copper export protein